MTFKFDKNGRNVFKGLTLLFSLLKIDLSELKGCAEDILNVTQMMECDFNEVRNIVGKGENAGYQHFLLFPPCFQNAFM